MRRLLPLILLALVVALAHPQAQSSAAENRAIGVVGQLLGGRQREVHHDDRARRREKGWAAR
jgi:hypothetical protein